MSTSRDQRLLSAIERACTSEYLPDTAALARPRQFAATFLYALGEALPGHSTSGSVALAYSAARSESPLASSSYHETWARFVLIAIVRQLSQQAFLNEKQGQDAHVYWKLIGELLSAAENLNGYRTTDLTAWPTERIIEAARDALAKHKTQLPLSGDENRLLASYVDNSRHIISLLATGKQSVENLLRATSARLDRWAGQEHVALWEQGSLAQKQLLTRRFVAEIAWVLAETTLHEQSNEERSRQACLWLLRVACQVAARVETVKEWLYASPTTSSTSNVAIETPKASQSTETTANKETTRPKERTMTDTKQALLKTLEHDATDAGWRMAGSQFVKLTREPIVAFLSRQLGPDDPAIRNRIAAFLDTDLGEALLSSMLSLGLSMLPETTGEVPKRLSRELRVRAMAETGDVIADLLMGPLRQVAVMYLQNIPSSTQHTDPVALPQTARDPLKVVSEVDQSQTVSVGEKSGR